jgi:hypothetical protein
MVYPGLLVLKTVRNLSRVILRGLLGLRLEETNVEQRGFRPAANQMRALLEHAGKTCLGGYQPAVKARALPALAIQLN